MNFLLVTVKDAAAISLREMILAAGHESEFCENGRAALQRAAETWFDVVLLDMKLPEMRSFDLVCQLKEAAPHINTVPLTNGVFREIITHSRRIGMAYFMVIQPEVKGYKIIVSSELMAWKKL